MALRSRFIKQASIASAEPVRGSGKDQPLIRMQGIVKTYTNAAGEFRVLKGIDTCFNRGEFVGIIGKSGSGKSTLINMITGIDRPTSGNVVIEGNDITSLSENQMAEWRGKNLGVVFQFFQLLPTLTLLENVMLPMDFCGMYDARERRNRAMQLLETVEMAEHADKLPSAISGGQQQRVAIARSLANDPPIIIADEPTGNLDSRTAEAIFNMFENLVKQGKTIVMVTHDTALTKKVSKTVLIADGEIVNEWIYKAFPTLTHRQMLALTHSIKAEEIEEGMEFIQETCSTEYLYIITEGVVEVIVHDASGKEVVAARMSAGDFVGEVELLGDGQAVASVRATEKPVKVIAVERESFLNLLSDSEPTRKAFEKLVHSRIQENQSARGGKRHAPQHS